MNLTQVFMFFPPVIAIILLAVNWQGMKKYIPAGLFAAFCAEIICHIAAIYTIWSYPIKPEEILVNFIMVPVLAMFWIRYAPRRLVSLFYWNLLWTIPLTLLEHFAETYTNVIKHHNGYAWYHSLPLWFISWFVWYGFHKWFYNAKPTAHST